MDLEYNNGLTYLTPWRLEQLQLVTTTINVTPAETKQLENQNSEYCNALSSLINEEKQGGKSIHYLCTERVKSLHAGGKISNSIKANEIISCKYLCE